MTDLSAQLWCEKQLELSLEKGRIKTEEMNKGSDRHQALHEEVATLITVKPQSLEDHVALRLHNSLVGLVRLSKEGMTRETPVIGKINSLFVIGSIDEIMLKRKVLKIIDTKTRSSNMMPSEAQKRTTRFQLMAYKHLFESIQQGRFTTDDFLTSYGLNKKSEITNTFLDEIHGLGDGMIPNISTLADLVFSLMKKLPPISDDLQVRYENQSSKKIIGIDDFQFNFDQFKRDCDFVEGFWLGKRDAIPVGEANKWKCNYCEFKCLCQDKMKPLDNFSD